MSTSYCEKCNKTQTVQKANIDGNEVYLCTNCWNKVSETNKSDEIRFNNQTYKLDTPASAIISNNLPIWLNGKIYDIVSYTKDVFNPKIITITESKRIMSCWEYDWTNKPEAQSWYCLKCEQIRGVREATIDNIKRNICEYCSDSRIYPSLTVFEFGKQAYYVRHSACEWSDKRLLLLMDNELYSCGFLESLPPQPSGFRKVKMAIAKVSLD